MMDLTDVNKIFVFVIIKITSVSHIFIGAEPTGTAGNLPRYSWNYRCKSILLPRYFLRHRVLLYDQVCASQHIELAVLSLWRIDDFLRADSPEPKRYFRVLGTSWQSSGL